MLNNSAELLQHGFTSTSYGSNGKAIFNNGFIAVTKDLIFGLSVWNGKQFIPLKEATQNELKHIISLIHKGNLSFPWENELTEIIQSFKNKEM